SIARLDSSAIARVHEEITPRPQTADDLHDLLCSLVVTTPRPEWQTLWGELHDRGRARFVDHDGVALWCATEMLGDARRVPAADAAWEPELLARRMRKHDATTLDRLCHDGEVAWLRLSPRIYDSDAATGAPNKATPIAVLYRDDLHWLLTAARSGIEPVEPAVGATA